MSKRYTSDGRRRSSMAHAQQAHRFDCGKIVFGNGYVLHRQSHGCRELTDDQWYARKAALGDRAAEEGRPVQRNEPLRRIFREHPASRPVEEGR